MKLVISFLFIIIFSPMMEACEIKKEQILVNLSGPITSLLREFKLLNSAQLVGISHFALSEKERKKFEKKLLLGGIFLSKKEIQKFKKAAFIFDKSQDLHRQLLKSKVSSLVELNTRGLNPFMAMEKSLKTLKPFLKNCEKPIKKLLEKKEEILSLAKGLKQTKPRSVLFFMGKIHNGKWPETLIINDGPIKFLKERGLIETYPSQADYIIWSQKILNLFLKKKPLIFGLYETQNSHLKKVKVRERVFNISRRGIFIPGLTQMEFLREFLYSFFYP